MTRDKLWEGEDEGGSGREGRKAGETEKVRTTTKGSLSLYLATFGVANLGGGIVRTRFTSPL